MGIRSADTWTRRTATVVALAFPVVAGAVALAASATYEAPPRDDGRSPGWQTIDHRGLDVEIPASWHRADLGGCEFEYEHWTVSADDACGQGPGVSFYASATYDAARGPGVRPDPPAPGPRRWSGYEVAGDVAVYVTAVHRGVAQRVLASLEAEPAVG
ncbi:hypothetical protein [uncultured Nocardioides sp.]|uniref:hypothetical protein n=1 Tax=uncultured Nocardioides sp. TaxID=198441 RepID=UPI002613DF18|nr:hypothetical protein [uncultured Nocardioides sp.]